MPWYVPVYWYLSAVPVGRTGFQGALQDIGGIRSMFLRDIVRERNRHAFRNQSEGLFPLRRSDQVGGTELVVISPSSPVRELFHPTAKVFFIRHGRARTALTQRRRDGRCHRSKRDQTHHQDFHVSSPDRAGA